MYYNSKEKKKAEPEPYSSQENAFIKYITQLDAIPNIVDTDFLRKYRRRVLFSGKIKGLSFITNPKTISLNSCMRNNIGLCEDAGLDDLADETVFDNIDICQVTRGTRGNLQYSLITQRKEFKLKDTSEIPKKGVLNRFIKPKEENPEQIQEGY